MEECESETEATTLPSPARVRERYPRTVTAGRTVDDARQAIRRLLRGEDRSRLLVVVGPCSIHDPGEAVEYAARLAQVAQRTRDELVVVMRTYVEKPRTTVGWKGLINDPDLDGSCRIEAGLIRARSLLLEINELGVPCACELVDLSTPPYISDLLSWAAVGARTSESQPHREMASGLGIPVGFKNGTDGALQPALNAMVAARHPHRHVGINGAGAVSILATAGNPDRHIILRGGRRGANHAAQDVEQVARQASDDVVTRPILVDCSHGNSGGDPHRQIDVCREVLEQTERNREHLLGFMLESNLEPGRQTWEPGRRPSYGVSITDACIDWDATEELLYDVALRLRGGPRRLRQPLPRDATTRPLS